MSDSESRTIQLLIVILAISVLLSGVAVFQVIQLQGQIADLDTAPPENENNTAQSPASSPQTLQFSLPDGTPEVYGEELGVRYDDVNEVSPEKTEEAISKMAAYDGLDLEGEEKERYIQILYGSGGEEAISCEYCCDAESVITSQGDLACECGHSFAMRGLTKYLLVNHGDTMSNDDIAQEVAKWKTLYFPDQTKSKALALENEGIESSFMNLATNEFRGVSSEDGDWVGDC